MFAWLSKLVRHRWTRRTRWTALLQNQRQFQRTLSKERLRVDRNGQTFGVIILRLEQLAAARTQTIRLARVLHRRLRDTDEKGHLGIGRIGVMLPDTDASGTELVLESVLALAAEYGLAVAGEAFVYPDRDDSAGPPHSEEDSVADLVGLATTVGEDVAAQRSTHLARNRMPTLPMHYLLAPYPGWKRSLDIAGAGIGLAIASPVIGLFAVIIRGSGPVFFTQDRTGYLGETFKIYKLRTMVQDAEQQQEQLGQSNERDGPAFKMRSDPRVTTVGRFLRATGLDELPQLYNVLKGDMSLVGPRPLPVSEADQCLPWQKQRTLVKPGLTCYWQLIKSRQVTFAQWMRLDMRYARRQSLRADLRLIVRTFAAVVLGRVGH